MENQEPSFLTSWKSFWEFLGMFTEKTCVVFM